MSEKRLWMIFSMALLGWRFIKNFMAEVQSQPIFRQVDPGQSWSINFSLLELIRTKVFLVVHFSLKSVTLLVPKKTDC